MGRGGRDGDYRVEKGIVNIQSTMGICRCDKQTWYLEPPKAADARYARHLQTAPDTASLKTGLDKNVHGILIPSADSLYRESLHPQGWTEDKCLLEGKFNLKPQAWLRTEVRHHSGKMGLVKN